MTDIDFYILSAQQPEQRLEFACRLIEKAYRSRCKILVQFDNLEQAKSFDELLWSFREGSFIPHSLLDANSAAEIDPNCPVHIVYDEQQPPHFDVLVNLATNIPSTFGRHKRVLEIVIQQDDVLKSTRNNYRFYKERGYPINNIDMRMKD